jgi:hypothetical protein
LTFAYYVAPRSALNEIMNNNRGTVRTVDNTNKDDLGFRGDGFNNKVRTV